MKKEQFIYSIPADAEYDIDEMSDKEIVRLAEKNGDIWSIRGFLDQLNHDEVPIEIMWFKLI